jgi:hypothetical protein
MANTNFFGRFINRAAEVVFGANESDVQQPTLSVESLQVEQIEKDDAAKTVTLRAQVGLTPIELTVPVGTTYLEMIELSKKQVPGLNVSAESVTILNTDTNVTVPNNAMTTPVQEGNYSFESTSGTAG